MYYAPHFRVRLSTSRRDWYVYVLTKVCNTQPPFTFLPYHIKANSGARARKWVERDRESQYLTLKADRNMNLLDRQEKPGWQTDKQKEKQAGGQISEKVKVRCAYKQWYRKGVWRSEERKEGKKEEMGCKGWRETQQKEREVKGYRNVKERNSWT